MIATTFIATLASAESVAALPPPRAVPSAEFALAEIVDSAPVPTYVIDANHLITHWNRACERLLQVPADDMIGTRRQWYPFYQEARRVLADFVVDCAGESAIDALYRGRFRRLAHIPGAFEATDFFPHLGARGYWVHATVAPLHDAGGRVIGAIATLQDVSEQKFAEQALLAAQVDLERTMSERTAQLAIANRKLADDMCIREAAEAELKRRNVELTELNARLSHAQQQLLQSERLASIGQLAAGVAHEVNNPIGYVFSNFSTLEGYLHDVFAMLAAYEAAEPAIADAQTVAGLRALRDKIELEFLKDDIPSLMRESKEGIGRVRKIVQDLKDFSRADSALEFIPADLHGCIDSTLNIVHNELKYRADVERCYGELPEVECVPSQINQVVLNLLVNATHAIGAERGRITVRTGCDEHNVWIAVEDNGCGIAAEHLSRIFDPFFTTKPVGKGTGLGLSITYGIVQNHHGTIHVASTPGSGTTFRIMLPIRQPVSP